MTRGLVQLETERVDVKSAVASAVEQSRPLIEARRHNLTIRTDALPSTVMGDRIRLVQVIVNLLNNAAKYTPQGGEITLTVHAASDVIDVSIIDNGMGIEGKLLPHVFDLFTQAERTSDRAQGGLGIGLALVKTLITLHGGTVKASSNGPGTGSTFTISLPAAELQLEKDIAALAASDMERSLQVASVSVSVMIVDDNVDAAESLAALLETRGHRVNVQSHPLVAIDAAKANPPQMFILDIGLPEIDGYELARRLRIGPGVRDAMFVALTGYGQAHDRVLSKAAGFDYHFVKPLDPEKLNAVLRAVGVETRRATPRPKSLSTP